MGLNAFMPSDSRLYNPNRDIAYCFGEGVLAEIIKRMTNNSVVWEEYADYCRKTNLTQADVAGGVECMRQLALTSVDNPSETMQQALHRVGFFQLKPGVRFAVAAYIGTVITGMAWHGIREVTMGGKGPVDDMESLREGGAEFIRLMAMPPWRRRLLVLRHRIVKAIRALRA